MIKKMYNFKIKNKKVRDNYLFMIDGLQQNMFDDNEVKEQYDKFSSLVVIEYYLKQLSFIKGFPSYIKTKDKNLYEWLEELKIQLIECDEEA
tara:strand:+ start:669 stop:944 length:276 start_codon:yes stop_codon:yes gene_type:complete